jgi:hypothetical protein
MEHSTDPLSERMDALAERLERVSRQNLRYRRAALGAVVAAAAVTTMGQAPVNRAPGEVRAQRFVLVDASGATRATLGVASDGSTRLELSDAAQRPRIAATVSGEVASLSVVAPGDNRLGTALTVDRVTSRLSLSDGTGTDRLWVAIRRQSPVVQFLDQKGAPRTGLVTINDDTGLAVVSQSTGASVPGLVLYGKDMDVVWSAPN